MSTMLLRLQKILGHVARIRSTITSVLLILMALIFMDDSDLMTIGGSTKETQEEIWVWLQLVVISWDGALHTTGGALNQRSLVGTSFVLNG